MRKKVITIQINESVLVSAHSWGKDEGLCKQVTIETLIVFGLLYDRMMKGKL